MKTLIVELLEPSCSILRLQSGYRGYSDTFEKRIGCVFLKKVHCPNLRTNSKLVPFVKWRGGHNCSDSLPISATCMGSNAGSALFGRSWFPVCIDHNDFKWISTWCTMQVDSGVVNYKCPSSVCTFSTSRVENIKHLTLSCNWRLLEQIEHWSKTKYLFCALPPPSQRR